MECSSRRGRWMLVRARPAWKGFGNGPCAAQTYFCKRLSLGRTRGARCKAQIFATLDTTRRHPQKSITTGPAFDTACKAASDFNYCTLIAT